MASTSSPIPSGASSYSSSVAANAVDEIQFSDWYEYILVQSLGNSGNVIYATADGSTPATSGAGSGVAVPLGGQAVLANGLVLWHQSQRAIAQGSNVIPGGASVSSPSNPGEVQPYMSGLSGQGADPGTTIKITSVGATAYTVSGA